MSDTPSELALRPIIEAAVRGLHLEVRHGLPPGLLSDEFVRQAKRIAELEAALTRSGPPEMDTPRAGAPGGACG